MLDVKELKEDNRLCVFIRHAEKDPDNYCLTDKGRQDIIKFAQSLCNLNKTIIIYSSPEERCIETARLINNIVNGSKQNINLSKILGEPGIQVKDEEEYVKLTNVMRCRDIYKEWKMGLHKKALNTPEYIKEKIKDFFQKTSKENAITIYISQSGTVACTGYSLEITNYKTDSGEWVDYLDGYVIRLCNDKCNI